MQNRCMTIFLLKRVIQNYKNELTNSFCIILAFEISIMGIKNQHPVSSSESSSNNECDDVELWHASEFTSIDGTQIVAFENGLCQLSNDHWTPIKENGKEYSTVVQYVLAQLARHFNNKKRLRQIMNATISEDQEDAAKMIDSYGDDEWKNMEKQFMKKGLSLKFQQHPKLRAALKGTGQSVIANCNTSEGIWATGTKLNDAQTRDMKKWTGQNLLGVMLMMVRAEN